MAREPITVLLINVRRITPETKEALLEASAGRLNIIDVLPEELDSVMPITFFKEEMRQILTGEKTKKKNAKKAAEKPKEGLM